ncbi:putative lipopolysaccharide heptosyltransferase III [soil metagenome]
MQRILVIQLKRIGDFILTVPALAALRAAKPTAEIVLLVPSAVADLAKCIPAVNRVIIYHLGRTNFETWSSAIAGEWDACLDFTGTDRSALLTRLSQAKRRIGYAKFAGTGLRKMAYSELCEASVRQLHTVHFHQALVQQYIGDSSAMESAVLFRIPQSIQTGAADKFAKAGLQGRFAVLHPGTAREEKFWLDERWADLAEHLHSRKQLAVVITGAGDGLERPHLQQIKKSLRVPVIDLTGQLTLVELAVLLEKCELIVGVDSMAMHLASLLARPQVALFGPTNPFHWRPLHDRGIVLQGNSGEAAQVFTPLSSGCEMKLISTDDVIHAIETLCTD